MKYHVIQIMPMGQIVFAAVLPEEFLSSSLAALNIQYIGQMEKEDCRLVAGNFTVTETEYDFLSYISAGLDEHVTAKNSHIANLEADEKKKVEADAEKVVRDNLETKRDTFSNLLTTKYAHQKPTDNI